MDLSLPTRQRARETELTPVKTEVDELIDVEVSPTSSDHLSTPRSDDSLTDTPRRRKRKSSEPKRRLTDFSIKRLCFDDPYRASPSDERQPEVTEKSSPPSTPVNVFADDHQPLPPYFHGAGVVPRAYALPYGESILPLPFQIPFPLSSYFPGLSFLNAGILHAGVAGSFANAAALASLNKDCTSRSPCPHSAKSTDIHCDAFSPTSSASPPNDPKFTREWSTSPDVLTPNSGYSHSQDDVKISIREVKPRIDGCKRRVNPVLHKLSQLTDDAIQTANTFHFQPASVSGMLSITPPSSSERNSDTYKLSQTSPNSVTSDESSGSSHDVGRRSRKNYKNMTRERRMEANARERTRVHTISAAFEELRKVVPAHSDSQKLSKLAILRIACSYILALARLAGHDYSADQSGVNYEECIEECSRIIESESKVKRRA